MGKRFVILDRDGTIIEERGYLSDPAQVALLPNAAAGLKRMAELGLGLIVVTNQSGVDRGYFDHACVEKVHARTLELLRAGGAGLDAIYYCPHLPDSDCACRKPRPRLLLDGAARFGFVPAESFVIGDKPCDIELGRAVGATTILVKTGYGAEFALKSGAGASYCVEDLLEAAEVIGRILGGGVERR